MLKKILITLLEIALIVLFIIAVISVVKSVSIADQHETIPWCVTEYKH